ncbi:rodlin [Streptomyces sp. NPDC096205]|uniref:rodlin n=1 Tax=Streptomyces sp. NPDC096205 TaxID=3366081 RepID=UPI0037F3DF87
MLKKAMAAAAIAASVVGASAAAAPQALAIGDGDGTQSASGNGAHSAFGNAVTKGKMSPQATLVQGSVNKLCAGVPVKANLQAILGIIAAVGVAQDVPILSAPQNQQCADNSTQAKGDEPLSNILSDISALSGNGEGNG